MSNGRDPSVGGVRELVDFALEALPGMQLPDSTFCYEVAGEQRNVRGRSLRYTLIVLIGLLRAERKGLSHNIDAQNVKAALLAELDSSELGPGDLGLYLWADARSASEASDRILDRLEGRIAGVGFETMDGIDLSWVLTGLGSIAASSRTEPLFSGALNELLSRTRTPSGLLMHTGAGRRRRFPNFATQIYGVLSLAKCAEVLESAEALTASRCVADAILALQLRDGGWPWIYDARQGRIVEPYEIYSVHQDAMAPMALSELSRLTGDERYREAAVRGLKWVWGNNELGCRMLDVDERGQRVVFRSIRRRWPLSRAALYANTVGSMIWRPPLASVRAGLEVNRSCRPYHLGWILEAWAGEV